mmetsp:Transcript_115/g.171  ORF Transcript_115/g.171 Transcript_115/m.171 type:complete len:592 (-) Transcript_115:39-1814(-)
MRVAILNILLLVGVQGQNVGDVVYYTTGGYVNENTICESECLNFAETRAQSPPSPYVGLGSPPNDAASGYNQTWCATVSGYSPDNTNKRKEWGYCGPPVTITASPSLAPTEFVSEGVITADGGGITQETECVFGGIVKWTDANGTNQERTFSADGCEAVAPGFPNTDFNLKAVTSNDTDTSMWCPTVNNYNGKASAQQSKKKEWGYCKTTYTTRYPTPEPTNEPSAEPTTSAPSAEPTTSSPSPSPSAEPTTAAPTVFVSIAEFFADGGGVGRNTPADASGYIDCVFPFTIKGVENSQGKEIEFNSCVNFSLGVIPYGLEAGESKDGFPNQPLNNDTDLNMWCPVVNDRYNRDPSNNVGRRWDWGYCLQIDTTRNPTASPVHPTESPTTGPTVFVPVTTLYTSGGGLSQAQPDVDELVCEPFDLKNCPNGNDYCEEGKIYDSCLSISQLPPYNSDSLGPNPNVTGVNSSLWCPINGRYNFNPSEPSKRFDWGYCRSATSTRTPTSDVTDAPTTSGTDAPTATVTDAPTTSTNAPTTTSTDAPTTSTNAPTTSTNAPTTSTNATSAPTSAGYVSAVPSMVVAIISIIVFATL